MPISVTCGDCGKGLKAPDALAGKKAKCPQCGSVIPIPAPVADAEEIDDGDPSAARPAASKSSSKPKPRAVKNEVDDDFEDEVEDSAEESNDGRRACPMCGEMIVATAAKCRFCGEVLDRELRKSGKSRSGRKGKGDPADLRTIAKHQKGILVCILIQMLIFGLQFAAPPQLRPLVGLAFLVASLAGTVFVFMLAMKVYSTGMGICFGILTIVPCVGLIMLLVVNSKATEVLKKNGIKVGLLGANLSDI